MVTWFRRVAAPQRVGRWSAGSAEKRRNTPSSALLVRKNPRRVADMRTKAKLADLLLREAGHGGLLPWAMEQRRRVKPPNWDEVAERLESATSGDVEVSGEILRKWLIAAEAEEDQKGGQR